MNTTARIQSAAGAATILALPLLYIGAVHRIVPVTAAGFTVFAIGMLVTPTLRFLPRLTRQEGAPQSARHQQPKRSATRRPQVEQDRAE